MKKFFTLILAMVAFVAASAQAPLYCTGDFEASKWAPATPVEFTYADGVYTLNVKAATSIKVSTSKGTWDEFNKGCITASGLQNGVAKKYSQGDANISLPWKGDYEITVDMSAKTIKVYTATPEPTGFTKVYIRGDMNGWGTPDAWEMTTTDGFLYEIKNVTISASQKWKIADADWAKVNYGAQKALPVTGSTTLDFNGSDCQFESNFTGNLSFHTISHQLTMTPSGDTPTPDPGKDCIVYWDNNAANWEYVYAYVTNADGEPLDDFPGNEMELTGEEGIYSYTVFAGYTNIVFSDGTEANKSDVYEVHDSYIYDLTQSGKPYDAPINYTGWYVNVPGEHNSWGDNGVKCNKDGIAEVIINGLAGGFKIKVWNGSEDVWHSNGKEIALGTPVEVAGNTDANMTLPADAQNATVKVTFNVATNMLLIEEFEVDYTTWYVNFVGDFNNWSTDDGVQCDSDGVATGSVRNIGDGGFKIQVWDGTNDIWYSTGAEVTIGKWFTIPGNTEANMTVPADNQEDTLMMTFNVVTGELLILVDDAVKSIDAEAAAPVYYNLQGQRVDNPANGIFIRRAGSEVTKVIR